MRLKLHQWLSLLCISSALLLVDSINQVKLVVAFTPAPKSIAQVPVAAIPISKNPSEQPVISAVGAIAIDQDSGTVLYGKSERQIFAPASTTKLMTALLARKVFPPGSILVVPSVAEVGGTKIGLVNGEKLSIESVLEGALIPSGNDAAHTIAANYPGGIEVFVAEMNQLARDLNLKNTYFNNPTGFDSQYHQTTARDLALLAREVMKDPLLRSIVGTKQTTIFDLTGKERHTITNTNHLLLSDPAVVGIKTGTTEDAGQVLITQIKENDHTIIIVVLGSIDRYADTIAIRQWIENGYQWQAPDLSVIK